MKVKYTAACECTKHGKYATVPEVTWSNTPGLVTERVADFHILCRVCHTRWNEELVESEEDEDV